jgi:hypothetical protein
MNTLAANLTARPFAGAALRARASVRASASRAAFTVVAREAPYAPGTTAPAYLTGSLPGDFGECRLLPSGLATRSSCGSSWQQRATAGVPGCSATRYRGFAAAPPPRCRRRRRTRLRRAVTPPPRGRAAAHRLCASSPALMRELGPLA